MIWWLFCGCGFGPFFSVCGVQLMCGGSYVVLLLHGCSFGVILWIIRHMYIYNKDRFMEKIKEVETTTLSYIVVIIDFN